MKFLVSFFTVSLLFIHMSALANSSKSNSVSSSRPATINCQIQGYEAVPQVASNYLKKFSFKKRIKVFGWESCFKQATLLSKAVPFSVKAQGAFRIYHEGEAHYIVGSMEKVRVFKWIYKVKKGEYRSGVISKFTDSNIFYPEEGTRIFDQGGVVLNIDTRPIE